MQDSSQPALAPLILVVDDEPTVRRIIEVMLKRAGYRIETAVNGTDALNKIRAMLPDLITLDYMMPDLSGEEVKQQMELDERTCSIPIIFVSAVADQLMARQPPIPQRQGVRYLQKPFPQEMLLGHVRELLAQREDG